MDKAKQDAKLRAIRQLQAILRQYQSPCVRCVWAARQYSLIYCPFPVCFTGKRGRSDPRNTVGVDAHIDPPIREIPIHFKKERE